MMPPVISSENQRHPMSTYILIFLMCVMGAVTLAGGILSPKKVLAFETVQLAQSSSFESGFYSLLDHKNKLNLPEGGKEKFLTILRNVILFLLSLIAVIALAAIIWAGVLYVASFGNEKRIHTAKQIILYAILGLLLAGGSFAIIQLVSSVLTK